MVRSSIWRATAWDRCSIRSRFKEELSDELLPARVRRLQGPGAYRDRSLCGGAADHGSVRDRLRVVYRQRRAPAEELLGGRVALHRSGPAVAGGRFDPDGDAR